MKMQTSFESFGEIYHKSDKHTRFATISFCRVQLYVKDRYQVL